MSETPGTYTGKDGREYRWLMLPPPYCRAGIGYDHCAKNRPNNGPEWVLEPIAPADWPAAKAALDALIEQEAGEWAEIDDHARIKRDGTQPQHRTDCGIGRWNDLTHPDLKRWPQAYRKGRSVAQQESAEMRDAARELVEAVGDFDEYLPWEGQNAKAYRWMKTAAKVLEEKL